MAVKNSEDAKRANRTNAVVEIKSEAVDDSVWDEARIEEAQRKLKEMYIQLRELRTTIPRLIEPLTTPQPSPAALVSAWSANVKTTNAEIAQFRKLVLSDESKGIFEHADQSRAENPGNMKKWKITEHPDWLDRNE